MSSPQNAKGSTDEGTMDELSTNNVNASAYAHLLNLPTVGNNQIGGRISGTDRFELLLLEQERQRRQYQSLLHEQMMHQQVIRNEIVPPNTLIPGDAGMAALFRNPQLPQSVSDLQRNQELQASAAVTTHNMLPASMEHTGSLPYNISPSNNLMMMTSGAAPLPMSSSSLVTSSSRPATTSNNEQSIFNRDANKSETTGDSSNSQTKKKMKSKKPKRPLSAYNFFFKHERERILKKIDEENEKKIDRDETSQELDQQDHENEVDQTGSSSKKSNKKRAHGKISFENLAKTIGVRWAKLDEKDMEYYKELADEDLKRYKKESSEYAKKEEAEKQKKGNPSDLHLNSAHHQIPFNMMNNTSMAGLQETSRQQQLRTLQQQIELSNNNQISTTNPRMQPQLTMQGFHQQNLLNLQSSQGLNIFQQTRQPYQQQQQQFMGLQYDPNSSNSQLQELLLMQQLNQRQSWEHNPDQLENQSNHDVKRRRMNDGRSKRC